MYIAKYIARLIYEIIEIIHKNINIASTLWINLPKDKLLVNKYKEKVSSLLNVGESDNSMQVTLKNRYNPDNIIDIIDIFLKSFVLLIKGPIKNK